jgi:hypothetical protein
VSFDVERRQAQSAPEAKIGIRDPGIGDVVSPRELLLVVERLRRQPGDLGAEPRKREYTSRS